MTGSVLVVCTGNVCRSPYLEHRLRQELSGTAIQVSSAGTGALAGHPMDDGSLGLLEARGSDGSAFRARQLSAGLLGDSDLVIAAGREHRSAAARIHPSALRKAVTLRDLADLLDGVTVADVAARNEPGTWVAQVVAAALARRAKVPARQDGVDIIDPIGQSRAVFERMASEIDNALQIIVPVLRGPAV